MITVQNGCFVLALSRAYHVIFPFWLPLTPIHIYKPTDVSFMAGNKPHKHTCASSVNMFKNKVDIYLRRAGYTQIDTLDRPKGFLVHLPSRVDSLGGNLVKSC